MKNYKNWGPANVLFLMDQLHIVGTCVLCSIQLKLVYQILDHDDQIYPSFGLYFKSAWWQFKNHQFIWEQYN